MTCIGAILTEAADPATQAQSACENFATESKRCQLIQESRMALFNESYLRERARRETQKSASAVLNERVRSQNITKTYDIFLSHAFDDRELLAGAVLAFEDQGYTVYLDWREDPELDRTRVSVANAALLRVRMRTSRCLIFAVTPGARDSSWMKWELGWKDGQNGRVAILPIETSRDDSWDGQEFLGLYPYIARGINTQKEERIWVHRNAKLYNEFGSWLNGSALTQH